MCDKCAVSATSSFRMPPHVGAKPRSPAIEPDARLRAKLRGQRHRMTRAQTGESAAADKHRRALDLGASDNGEAVTADVRHARRGPPADRPRDERQTSPPGFRSI